MITSGVPIKAEAAAAIGLIDEVGEGDDIAAIGMAFARRVIDEKMPVRRTRDANEKIKADAGNTKLFEGTRALLNKKARGMLSPFKCVDAGEAATTQSFCCKRHACMDRS